jgi:hypothetical protein
METFLDFKVSTGKIFSTFFERYSRTLFVIDCQNDYFPVVATVGAQLITLTY